MSIRTFFALTILAVAPLSAQLAAPNNLGATIGHLHLNVRDVDAHQRFWIQMGGTPVNNEKLQMVQFPEIYIVLRKQEPTGGSVGSVINHIGFYVKNINDWLPKWKAAGLNVETRDNPKQAFVTAPDDIRIEINENTAIATPIAFYHIHMFLPDPQAAQDWYVKTFGAVAGKGRFPTGSVPGAVFTLAPDDNKPQASTKGRSLDHIGFEIKNLDQFVKNLEAAGIHTEAPIRTSANASKLRLAYIMDPWGTYIELTEGLVPTSAQSASR